MLSLGHQAAEPDELGAGAVGDFVDSELDLESEPDDSELDLGSELGDSELDLDSELDESELDESELDESELESLVVPEAAVVLDGLPRLSVL